jgi:hypothetical protein
MSHATPYPPKACRQRHGGIPALYDWMNIVWLAFPFPRAPKLLSGLRAPEALRDQGVRRAKNGLFGAHSAFKFG